MRKIIVANWKMNVPRLNDWAGFRAPSGVIIVICPPFPYLPLINFKKMGVKIGAQDLFWENLRSGSAYTGEVSADMLKSFGVEYVIVGHSERRANLNETNEIVNKKIKTALSAGLKVIFCVGESKNVRSNGMTSAKNFVRAQIKAGLTGVKKNFLRQIIVSYEPIWAIGTGASDKPESSVEMAVFIKSLLPVRVLYGGSVNEKNAEKFLSKKELDGALIGRASVDAKQFKKITNIK